MPLLWIKAGVWLGLSAVLGGVAFSFMAPWHHPARHNEYLKSAFGCCLLGAAVSLTVLRFLI